MQETLPKGVVIAGPLTPTVEAVLTPTALAFLADLQRKFNSHREQLLARRVERQKSIDAGETPSFLPETVEIRQSEWQVAPAPDDLNDRRVEITGPTERKMMINALNQATRSLPPPPEENKVIPFSEDERAFSTLQGKLRWICQKLGHQVMFVLDDFDQVLEIGPLNMLEQLNVLRSDGNRGFLSYLVITKRLPHILGQNHPLANNSKFYDLFRHHIYALEPYAKGDAMRMLEHLNQIADNKLADSDLEQIYQFAGGHESHGLVQCQA